MKKILLAFISVLIVATVGLSMTGCRGEQSSTLPYVSSKDEIYYATDDMPAQTQPSTDDSNNKKSKQSSNPVNPDTKQIAEDTTYPTAVSQSSLSPNNNNSGSSKASDAITLSSSSLDIKVGQSKTITVSINIDKTGTSAYTAETNNSNATISCSGSDITITGKKAGNTVLIVKSGSKKASCNIIIIGNQTTEQIKNITDDTEVKYNELCTDYYQAKITSGINIDFYNNGNGAIYTSSLKKDDNEASIIEIPYSKLKNEKTSINKLVDNLSKQFEDEMKKSDKSEEFDIKNYRINCYSEKESGNEYTIYFCYKEL